VSSVRVGVGRESLHLLHNSISYHSDVDLIVGSSFAMFSNQFHGKTAFKGKFSLSLSFFFCLLCNCTTRDVYYYSSYYILCSLILPKTLRLVGCCAMSSSHQTSERFRWKSYHGKERQTNFENFWLNFCVNIIIDVKLDTPNNNNDL
jgi:hypothetical protein